MNAPSVFRGQRNRSLHWGLLAGGVATFMLSLVTYARAETISVCDTPEAAWNALVSEVDFNDLKKSHQCASAQLGYYPTRVVEQGFINDKRVYIVGALVPYHGDWYELYVALDGDPFNAPLTRVDG